MCAARRSAHHAGVETVTHEVAPGVYRLSTLVTLPGVPQPMATNQFLVVDEEPVLVHTGFGALFPDVSRAVSRVIALDRVRWITFGHVEADQCGGLDRWQAATGATVIVPQHPSHGPGSRWMPAPDDGGLAVGALRLDWLPTAHLPQGWGAHVIVERTSGVMFCGDLFAHLGPVPALTVDGDAVERSLAADRTLGWCRPSVESGARLRQLAGEAPRTLLPMHGPGMVGDAGQALRDLADAHGSQAGNQPGAPPSTRQDASR
jgi:glyoxylase-like metal-dependent hydrolase (beta-lactamase superfamily II)